jgi:hypothetical protein
MNGAKMQHQIDVRKLQYVLSALEQKITDLAKEVDAGNARYCALAAFVLSLPNLAAADQEKAIGRLRSIRRIGSSASAMRELESLLAVAKADQNPEENAA